MVVEVGEIVATLVEEKWEVLNVLLAKALAIYIPNTLVWESLDTFLHPFLSLLLEDTNLCTSFHVGWK